MKPHILKGFVIVLFIIMIFLFYSNYTIAQKERYITNQISMLQQEKKNFTIPSYNYALSSYPANIEKMAKFLYIQTSLEGIKFSIQQQRQKKDKAQQQTKKTEIIKKQYTICFSGPIEQSIFIIKTLFFAFPIVLTKMNATKDTINLTINFYGKNDRHNPT